MNIIEKRIRSDEILEDKALSEEQKLFLIFQIYKKELVALLPQLFHSLLMWKETRLQYIRSPRVIGCLEEFIAENRSNPQEATIQDCINNYVFENQHAILSDGRLIGFKQE